VLNFKARSIVVIPGKGKGMMQNKDVIKLDTHNVRNWVADIEAITEVTIAAFKDHPISRHTEQFIIKALRNADALTLSLVAEMDGKLVGHIAFSPVTVSDGTTDWYGIGPVCKACSNKLCTIEDAKKQSLKLLDGMSGHPAISEYRGKDFEIITF